MKNVLKIESRYDKLQKQQKNLRNKIQRINTRENAKAEELRRKANEIEYKKRVKVKDLKNKLKDVISLTDNEVNRILQEEFGDTKILEEIYEYKKENYSDIGTCSFKSGDEKNGAGEHKCK